MSAASLKASAPTPAAQRLAAASAATGSALKAVQKAWVAWVLAALSLHFRIP